MSKFLKRNWLTSITTISFVVLISGCSWFKADEDEFEEAKTLRALDVPPDLIRPYSDDKLVSPVPDTGSKQKTKKATDCQCKEQIPSIGERVLPQGKGVQRLRDGQHRWLLVSAEPEQVWPLARKFLEMRGYRIQRDEPAVGIIESDWKTRFEDAGNTDSGSLPNLRERLRLRLEPGQTSGRTEVYLSQYLSERTKSDDTEKKDQWQLRSQDSERAIEMLNRFAQYLAAENVEDAVPLTPIVSKLSSNSDGGSVLIVEAEFARVWRRTGIALDALGFVIEDQDRASRTYNVYNETSSGKTKEELEHGKPESATVRENFRIQLEEKSDITEISIRTAGSQIDNSKSAIHVLNLLRSQFQ